MPNNIVPIYLRCRTRWLGIILCFIIIIKTRRPRRYYTRISILINNMNNTMVIVREVTAAVRQRCRCPWRRAAAVTWAGAAVPARYLAEGTAVHHAHQDARAAFRLRPTGPSDVPHTLPYQSERQRDPGSPTSLVVLHTPHCRPVSARQRHSHPLQRSLSPPDR